jgi:hypothetical protein
MGLRSALDRVWRAYVAGFREEPLSSIVPSPFGMTLVIPPGDANDTTARSLDATDKETR